LPDQFQSEPGLHHPNKKQFSQNEKPKALEAASLMTKIHA
jgi:hypothetical protein